MDKTKQIVITDKNGDVIFLDGGTLEECSDGIILKLSIDATKESYSLKKGKTLKGVTISDDKLMFILN